MNYKHGDIVWVAGCKKKVLTVFANFLVLDGEPECFFFREVKPVVRVTAGYSL